MNIFNSFFYSVGSEFHILHFSKKRQTMVYGASTDYIAVLSLANATQYPDIMVQHNICGLFVWRFALKTQSNIYTLRSLHKDKETVASQDKLH